MKICYLAAADSAHSHRWIHFFVERGHQVSWLSLVPPQHPVDKRIDFRNLGWGSEKSVRQIASTLGIRRLVGRIAPDIVHAHYAGWYGVLGMLSGVRPLVVTAWGSDVLIAGRSRFRGALVRRVLHSADLLTCDAYHMVEAMKTLGADKEKMRLVYFGVEPNIFSPGPPDGEVRAGWDADNRPVVISLRSLEPIYDVRTLIDCIPDVRSEISDVLFVIAGSGSQAAVLKEQVQELSVVAQVRFTGRYGRDCLPRMLRSADAYVSTALSDAGIAASTAEAMACAVPVVITDTGENHRWVADGESGYLVAAGNAVALAERIKVVLRDRESAKRMGRRGRAVVVERNNYVREMEKMEAFYEELAMRGWGRRDVA